MKKDEKKKKKWELDRIMARERPIVEDPTHDTFLCVWKDTILDSIEDLEKEQQDFRTDRVVKMDDGKYLVTWAPTWEPASDIRRDAPKPVNEWRKYEKFMKESHSTETKAAAPPRHVVHSDSESNVIAQCAIFGYVDLSFDLADASSCYSSRSPEPVGTFIDHHGGPRKPYFLKSITGLGD